MRPATWGHVTAPLTSLVPLLLTAAVICRSQCGLLPAGPHHALGDSCRSSQNFPDPGRHMPLFSTPFESCSLKGPGYTSGSWLWFVVHPAGDSCQDASSLRLVSLSCGLTGRPKAEAVPFFLLFSRMCCCCLVAELCQNLLLLFFNHYVVSDSFATSWTIAHQAPLSMGFLRQENCSELPFPSPGGPPDPRIKPMSPPLAGGFFTTREKIVKSVIYQAFVTYILNVHSFSEWACHWNAAATSFSLGLTLRV